MQKVRKKTNRSLTNVQVLAKQEFTAKAIPTTKRPWPH